MFLHQHRRRGLALLLAILALYVTGPGYSAVPPTTMDYQGHLADASGVPVNGAVAMTFTLYTDAAGTNPVWTEDHALVAVTQGLFSVTLGVTNALDSAVFGDNTELYLGIRVAADATALAALSNLDDMTPRQAIHSAAYAYKADDANKVGGISGATISQTSSDLAAHLGNTANPHGVTAAQLGAVSASDLTTHQGNPSAHHRKTDSFAELLDVAADAQVPDSLTRDTELLAGLATKADAAHEHNTLYYTQAEVDGIVTGLVDQLASLQAQVEALNTLLAGVSRNGNDIVISGANLQIVSGLGTTDGRPVGQPNAPAAVNGLGNLIIGYNERRGVDENGVPRPDITDGSHNLIIGSGQNYASYGGLVAGYWNEVTGAYASVTGGSLNRAIADFSSVSGGSENIAGDTQSNSGAHASVSGGLANNARGAYTSISGGEGNEAGPFGTAASVSGGFINKATSPWSSVSGGENNDAGNSYASVSGGSNNEASGLYSSISGGQKNKANLSFTSVSGGYLNVVNADNASIAGGRENTVSAQFGSIAGGILNSVTGLYASVTGGQNNTASGSYASVNGGLRNTASGAYTTAGGGYATVVSDSFDWAAGSATGVDAPPAPTARPGGPYSAVRGTPITLNGSASTANAPEATLTTHRWTFSSGGPSSVTNNATPTVTFTVSGTFTATLTVTDSLGGTNSTSTTVTVSP